MADISGLDMGPTIDWYTQSNLSLPALAPGPRLSIQDLQRIHVTEYQLSGLFNFYPKEARARSVMRTIVGQPMSWFDKDMTEGLRPTTDIAQALTPTAHIPSYIWYGDWTDPAKPVADVYLYQLPSTIQSNIRRIIHAQGFVHEVGHSIVQPAMYVPGYTLQMPNGQTIGGLDLMLQFGEMAEKHVPISHYASAHRGPQGKFESEDEHYNVRTAISEELCETLAAHFLGFAYCGDDWRGRNPLADRPEIRRFAEDFLHAKRIQ